MRNLGGSLTYAVMFILVVAGTSGCDLTRTKAPPQNGVTVRQEVIHTIPLEGSAPQHVVTGITTLPSGASTGRHIHRGLECGYVLTGQLELINDGQPARYFWAGDTFLTYRDLPHTVRNPGTGVTTVLSALVVDDGEPATLPLG
jgi:quercetin dioxygenase-like cupin family protein